MRKAEHCSGRPISLCGFHAKLSESSHPFMRWRCSGLSSAAAPQHPSTCIHTLCLLQIAAIFSKGSKAPSTVVPAVVPTKKGTCVPKTRTLLDTVVHAHCAVYVCAACTFDHYLRQAHGCAMEVQTHTHSLTAVEIILSDCDLLPQACRDTFPL